ncbi:hypothetical protein BOTBODRAFT_76139, partial [Botryobasidium botryosum FD-172 SS1]
VGDYPEQTLVGGCVYGHCPKCTVPPENLGDPGTHLLHDLEVILNAFSLADSNSATFNKACRDAGVKLIYHPFWEDLPYINIYCSIMLDILHQLCQGVIKHLVAW